MGVAQSMEARVARLEARDEVNSELVQKMSIKIDALNKALTDLVAADKAKAKMMGFVMTFGPALGVVIAKIWG